MANCFSSFDMFVLPSYREGLPTVLLQAMAMGIPCVGTNIRGSRELIQDGLTGLLVEPKSAETLARALASIISDPDLAARIADKGESRILENYSQTFLLPRTLGIIGSVIEKHLPQDSPANQ